MDPPAYNADYDLALAPEQEDQELPSYEDVYAQSPPSTPRVVPTTSHAYGLRRKRDGPEWFILHVTSKSRRPEQIPLFYQGDPVTGSVELNLEEEMIIRAVDISLTGDLITTDGIQSSFLNLSQRLWSGSGSQSSPGSSSDGVNPELISGTNKLTGHFQWPFTLEMPDSVVLKAKKAFQTYRLPASFLERGARVTVIYRLMATVTRSRLQGTSCTDTVIQYLPRIRPDPPSIARQLAYQDGHPLIGPSGDPEGWFHLEPVVVSGTLLNTREVSVKCSLSLAKPLSYTRGATIPLCLRLQSTDALLLDTLSSPGSIVVRLNRVLTIQRKTLQPPGGSGRVINPRTVTIAGTAVWWAAPFETAADNDSSRFLQGEISLARNLAPPAHLDCY